MSAGTITIASTSTAHRARAASRAGLFNLQRPATALRIWFDSSALVICAGSCRQTPTWASDLKRTRGLPNHAGSVASRAFGRLTCRRRGRWEGAFE
jgi:hypothetical protein